MCSIFFFFFEPFELSENLGHISPELLFLNTQKDHVDAEYLDRRFCLFGRSVYILIFVGAVESVCLACFAPRSSTY